jgi:hypothetical protein
MTGIDEVAQIVFVRKRLVQASRYPKVGVDQFVVHGICKSSTCPCRGDNHFVLFTVDWSTTR